MRKKNNEIERIKIFEDRKKKNQLEYMFNYGDLC